MIQGKVVTRAVAVVQDFKIYLTLTSFISRSEAGFSEADLLKGLSEGRFKNIVIMCGAGISTNAGIPDFRSPSAGE